MLSLKKSDIAQRGISRTCAKHGTDFLLPKPKQAHNRETHPTQYYARIVFFFSFFAMPSSVDQPKVGGATAAIAWFPDKNVMM